MKELRIKISCLSVLILLIGCGIPKNCIVCDNVSSPGCGPVIELTTDLPVLYSADFEVLNYHFSGLIAFRCISETSETRIVFLTEVGFKVMEFTMKNNKVTNTYRLEAVDRKALVKFMERFISLLLIEPQCQKICKVDSINKSTYFCRSKNGSFLYEFAGNTKEQTIYSKGKKNKAEGLYSSDPFLPEEVKVRMKYNTHIQLKKVSNAFQ